MRTEDQPGNHIRLQGEMRTVCGQQGGSISDQHYRDNPTGHVQTLPMCEDCVRLVDAHARG